MLYIYIIKVETTLLRLYKIDPFGAIDRLSVIDLNTYMTQLEHDEKKEHDSMKKNTIMECLKGISDYLNVMFYKK